MTWDTSAVAPWLTDFALLATVVLGAAGAAHLFLKQPARRMMVARAAALGLGVLALLVALPGWPRIGWRETDVKQPPQAGVSQRSAAVDIAPAAAQPLAAGHHGEGRLTPTASQAAVDRPGNRGVWHLPSVVPTFVTGAALAILWLLIGAVQTRRLRRQTHEAPARLQAILARIVEAGAILPELRISPKIAQPVALGAFRPTIILPESFADGEAESDLELAIAHEWAHIRNGDLRLLAMLRLLMPLLVAHPLYWWLRRKVRLDQEVLADVSAARGDRLRYAETLVAWSRAGLARSPVLRGTLAMWEQPSLLTRRIVMLLDHDLYIEPSCSPRWRTGVLGSMALGVLGLSLLTLRPSTGRAARPLLALQADATGFRGRVVDPAGHPVAGASLRLLILADRRNAPEPRAISGRDGRFLLPVPPEELARLVKNEAGENPRVVATATGLGFGWADPVDGKDVTVRLVADDVPILGRVIDSQGRPAAGVSVKIHNFWASPNENLSAFIESVKASGVNPWEGTRKLDLVTLDLEATTGADGRFRLDGIGRDRVAELLLTGPSMASAEVLVITRDVPTIKPIGWERFEPKARSYHGARFDHVTTSTKPVTGTVRDRDSGQPLAGIKVRGYVTGDDGRSSSPTVFAATDAQGHFRLTGLPFAKKYQLFAYATNGAPYLSTGLPVTADPRALEELNRDIALKRGMTVRGRLTDKLTGRPVPASVAYHAIGDNPLFRDALGYGIETRAGLDGLYEIVVPPGRGVITAVAHHGEYMAGVGADAIQGLDRVPALAPLAVTVPGMSRYHIIMEINLKATDDPLTRDMAFEAARTQTVRVVGPDGKPVAETVVMGFSPHDAWNQQILESTELTVPGLNPREPRQMTFFQIDRKLAGALSIRGDEPGPLTVRLQPWSVITGRIVDDQGRPRIGLTLTNTAPNRLEPDSGLFPRRATVDDHGRFKIEGLVPGLKYSAELIHDPWFVRGKVFEGIRVEPGETRDLGDIKLGPLAF